jgi:hypothetical protein
MTFRVPCWVSARGRGKDVLTKALGLQAPWRAERGVQLGGSHRVLKLSFDRKAPNHAPMRFGYALSLSSPAKTSLDVLVVVE